MSKKKKKPSNLAYYLAVLATIDSVFSVLTFFFK